MKSTGLLFGISRHEKMPAGTSLGRPVFYLRISDGTDGLVRFEIGTATRFAYITTNREAAA